MYALCRGYIVSTDVPLTDNLQLTCQRRQQRLARDTTDDSSYIFSQPFSQESGSCDVICFELNPGLTVISGCTFDDDILWWKLKLDVLNYMDILNNNLYNLMQLVPLPRYRDHADTTRAWSEADSSTAARSGIPSALATSNRLKESNEPSHQR